MDQEAITWVWNAYEPLILRFVTRLTGYQNEAEEIVGTTFIKFIEALHAGKGPTENVKAYLYRIAYNEFVNNWKISSTSDELDEELMDKNILSPEREAAQQQEIQQINNALNRLTPDQKELIILRFVEELSMKETAQIMGKTINAIKTMQTRAIHQLSKSKELQAVRKP